MTPRRTLLALSLVLLAGRGCPLPRAAPLSPLIGIASVIDGDTLVLHGTHVRLHGIDAPESSQQCVLAGTPWRCGQAAALALAGPLGSHTVTCVSRGTDRYGRTIARCTVAGDDVERWLVHEGWAVAYRKYSADYIPDEKAAHAAQRGIWASTFTLLWEWRHRDRQESGTRRPLQDAPGTPRDAR